MKKLIIALLFVSTAFSAISQDIPKWKVTDVQKYMAPTMAYGVLVINFWASFCKPCVAEIPSFIKISDKYKNDNVKLLLVSLDLPASYPAKISDAVKKNNFNTNIVWLDETNADYFCPMIDTHWSGSIPSTLIVNTKTGYRKFFEDEMKADMLEKEVQIAIKN